MAASGQWPFGQPDLPVVRGHGSSRTEGPYHWRDRVTVG